MTKIVKRVKEFQTQINKEKKYTADEAFDLLKNISKVKFTESVDVSVRLGIDPRKTDQNVRGSVVLPKGIGKKVRVAVFAPETEAQEAKQAGADIVGLEDLAEQVKKDGGLDVDVVIATPSAMKVVGTIGQILGPKGLMPNPKVGTVTQNVKQAVENAKTGQVRYRNDKAGIIHCSIGKCDFNIADLKENLLGLVGALKKAKPDTSKGVYLKKVSVSTTMGPGLAIDIASLGL